MTRPTTPRTASEMSSRPSEAGDELGMLGRVHAPADHVQDGRQVAAEQRGRDNLPCVACGACWRHETNTRDSCDAWAPAMSSVRSVAGAGSGRRSVGQPGPGPGADRSGDRRPPTKGPNRSDSRSPTAGRHPPVRPPMLCMVCMDCTSHTPGSGADHGRQRRVRGIPAVRQRFRTIRSVGRPNGRTRPSSRPCSSCSSCS